MLRAVVCLMLALESLASSMTAQASVALALRTGLLLRTHVVAQDDTEEMQQVKLRVRDAVIERYAENPPALWPSAGAVADALPALREAAELAARDAGFEGGVTVAIESLDFDDRTLEGLAIPAGRYPALMIRLGDARGHNWWGLLDPELALRCAALAGDTPEDIIEWDWSLRALLHALMGLPLNGREGNDA